MSWFKETLFDTVNLYLPTCPLPFAFLPQTCLHSEMWNIKTHNIQSFFLFLVCSELWQILLSAPSWQFSSQQRNLKYRIS